MIKPRLSRRISRRCDGQTQSTAAIFSISLGFTGNGYRLLATLLHQLRKRALLITHRSNRGLKHTERLVHLLSGDHQRDENTNHIRVRAGSNRDQAMFVTVLRYFLSLVGCWSLRLLRLHKFDGLHASESAHVADDRPAALPLASAALKMIAEFIGTGEQVIFLEQIEHCQSRSARQRIPRKSSAQPSWPGRIHNFGAASHRGKRQPATERLRGYEKIRFDAVALAGKQRARAPKTRLHFVGDEEDAMLVAKLNQYFEIVWRRGDKSAFPQHRLSDHGRDFFVGHHALERVFQVPRTIKITRWIRLRVRAAVAVSERDAVDLAWKRRESCLVRMRLAGQGQRHHRPSVKSVFEGDEAGPLRINARDFYGVFNRFSSAVHEDCLLRELARSDFIHALGQPHIALIWRDLHTGVQKAVELIFHGVDDFIPPVTHVDAANASGKVEIAVAIDVFEPGVFSLGYVDRRPVGKAAGHGFRAALRQRLRLRAGNRSAELNGRHRKSSCSLIVAVFLGPRDSRLGTL